LPPVRVNGVCTGAVDTELWHRLAEAERLATFARIGARLPVGRAGRQACGYRRSLPVFEAYLYLMKTGSSAGETIVVNGGALQAPQSDHGKCGAAGDHNRAQVRKHLEPSEQRKDASRRSPELVHQPGRCRSRELVDRIEIVRDGDLLAASLAQRHRSSAAPQLG
jgi:hypothetical protein